MGSKYSKSSSRVMVFVSTVQNMYSNKVIPDAGGRGHASDPPLQKNHMHPNDQRLPLPHDVQDKQGLPIQHPGSLPDALVVQRISRSARTHSRVIDLFDIQSSQDSHDGHDPPLPLFLFIVIARGARRAGQRAMSPTVHAAASSARRLSLVKRMTTMMMRRTSMTEAFSFSLGS
jgi:hypothetical protein